MIELDLNFKTPIKHINTNRRLINSVRYCKKSGMYIFSSATISRMHV